MAMLRLILVNWSPEKGKTEVQSSTVARVSFQWQIPAFRNRQVWYSSVWACLGWLSVVEKFSKKTVKHKRAGFIPPFFMFTKLAGGLRVERVSESDTVKPKQVAAYKLAVVSHDSDPTY